MEDDHDYEEPPRFPPSTTEFGRKADERRKWAMAMMSAPPPRTDVAALKARWDKGDRNVQMTAHEDGRVTYRVQFTPEQKAELETAYLEARTSGKRNLRDQAELFVNNVEWIARTAELSQAIVPEKQKDRIRALQNIANGLTLAEQGLAALDRDANGLLYATVADAFAREGIQVSGSEDRLTSMVENPLRAIVEGDQLRQLVRRLTAVTVKAANDTVGELPKHDHHQWDVRLTDTLEIQRLIIENQIPFETTETGFAAKVLRAMFDLAGIEIDRVSYWLKKASDDPRSFARFRQSMRDQDSQN